MLLKDATDGCRTVELSKKLVPDQKASSAVPPRAMLIVGNATDKLVESIDTPSTSLWYEIKVSGLGSRRRVCFIVEYRIVTRKAQ